MHQLMYMAQRLYVHAMIYNSSYSKVIGVAESISANVFIYELGDNPQPEKYPIRLSFLHTPLSIARCTWNQHQTISLGISPTFGTSVAFSQTEVVSQSSHPIEVIHIQMALGRLSFTF